MDIHLTNFNIENVKRSMAALSLPEETVTLIYNAVNNWIGAHQDMIEEVIREAESFAKAMKWQRQRSREEFGF